MAFLPTFASELIEFLQPKLDSDDFAHLLMMIEGAYQPDAADNAKSVTAMDRAIDRAHRAPKRERIAHDSANGLDRGFVGGKKIDTTKAQAEISALCGKAA